MSGLEGESVQATKRKFEKGEEDLEDYNVENLYDEYEYDSSDEEDIRNTIGNVPLEWYREFDHLGYDIDASKILKPERFNEIDNFLKKHDDPNYWRTVTDPKTGRSHVLTSEELRIINSIFSGKYPTKETSEMSSYPPLSAPMQTAIIRTNPSKLSFMEIKPWEQKKIEKLRRKIAQQGFIRKIEEPTEEFKFYDIWTDAESKGLKAHSAAIPAPKLAPPTHAESYNPPPEYLWTEEEEAEFFSKDVDDRETNFVPRKFRRLRNVPAYKDLLQERFERCLDLYLCPRQKKLMPKATVDELLPKVPKPADLRPFPYLYLYSYNVEKSDTEIAAVSLDVHSSGHYIAVSFDDHKVRVFEVDTSSCLLTFAMIKPISSVRWSPNSTILAITAEKLLYFVNTQLGDAIKSMSTDERLNLPEQYEGKESACKWKVPKPGMSFSGRAKLVVSHDHDIETSRWHRKGDYILTICPEGGKTKSVIFHRVSTKMSQLPFADLKGEIVDADFHPFKPALWLVSTKEIRLFDLVGRKMKRKLEIGHSGIFMSSFSLHRSGDNMLVGGRDARLVWYDSALSSAPYQIMRYHKDAVTSVAFHPRYPLFASASSREGLVVVAHATVSDLNNAMIVPLKQIKLKVKIAAIRFHPVHPWLFVSLQNGETQLYVH